MMNRDEEPAYHRTSRARTEMTNSQQPTALPASEQTTNGHTSKGLGQWLGTAVQLLLVVAIIVGSIQVFKEQRVRRLYDDEAASLEQKLDAKLPAESKDMALIQLQRDQSCATWYYHIPPNRGAVLKMWKSGEEPIELLRWTPQPTAQRNILQIEFAEKFSSLSAFGNEVQSRVVRPNSPNQFTEVQFLTVSHDPTKSSDKVDELVFKYTGAMKGKFFYERREQDKVVMPRSGILAVFHESGSTATTIQDHACIIEMTITE